MNKAREKYHDLEFEKGSQIGSIPPMKIGAKIKSLRKALGLNQKALARKCKVAQSAVSQWEVDKRFPEPDTLPVLARALGVTVSELMNVTDDNTQQRVSIPQPLGTSASKQQGLDLGERPPTFGLKDLPILGTVRGGVGGFSFNGESLGMTERPRELVGVKEAYAAYVDESSMYPAYEPGDLVWVNPHKPVRPRNTVIIQISDNEAYIKKLVRRTEKHIICEQFNPAGELKYDVKTVRAVHLVVGKINAS